MPPAFSNCSDSKGGRILVNAPERCGRTSIWYVRVMEGPWRGALQVFATLGGR